jgi:hypothetical protein
MQMSGVCILQDQDEEEEDNKYDDSSFEDDSGVHGEVEDKEKYGEFRILNSTEEIEFFEEMYFEIKYNYKNKFENFVNEKFGQLKKKKIKRKRGRGGRRFFNRKLKFGESEEPAELEQKFREFYEARTCSLGNIHMLHWLGLVDFDFILRSFYNFIRKSRRGNFEDELKFLDPKKSVLLGGKISF